MEQAGVQGVAGFRCSKVSSSGKAGSSWHN
jgi:hypothetical protein